jgi:outer membrane protein assembly factor BamB
MKPTAVGLLLLTLALPARADDWPTFQHDGARSGVTADRVAVPLAEQWSYRSASPPRTAWPPPQAGWTELPKVDFDDALYTVADRDTVYFGSSVDHQVHAIDASTGTPRWQFFTGGPVRLAPTLANDRVYFGSDDGKVYSVNRADGSAVWSRDLSIDPRRVIGNGQISSLWPVRTGIVVADGRVYCGSGVFPYHKVALHALDAATGEPAWKADALTTTGGFSPQGYPLLIGKSLIVPAGRASPLFVKRENGEALFSVAPVTEKGGATGTYGTIVEDTLFVGTQNTLYGVNTENGGGKGKLINADRMVASPQFYFVLKGPPAPAYGRKNPSTDANDISCIDRAAWAAQPKKDEAGLKAARKWRFAKPGLASLILAGPHLIAGGPDAVYIVDAATGQEVWSGKVDGLAVGLTVANGRLVVSTTKGAVHCFGPGATAASPAAAMPPKSDPAFAETAKAMLREADGVKGFALVVGKDCVPLACELAKQSQFKITCVEFEAARLPALRKEVAATGLYGHRVTVEAGTAEKLPFPDLAANLVVALDPPPAASELLRVLKPCGGVLLTSNKVELPDVVKKAGTASTLNDRGWTKLVRSELPGSGWWTHQFADAGGSGSSGDARIKGRLDVLWFGEPGADRFPDRHQRGAAPLIANGRVFCEGWNFLTKKTTVFCFDEYNGQQYWERDIEDAVRLNLPAVSGNLACDADSVYIAGGSQCHRLDARTGETKAVYETPTDPDGENPDWGYLAVSEGKVVGSAAFKAKEKFSDVLFAFDIKTGQKAWQTPGREIRDTTITMGTGKVLFADNRRRNRTRWSIRRRRGRSSARWWRWTSRPASRCGSRTWTSPTAAGGTTRASAASRPCARTTC